MKDDVDRIESSQLLMQLLRRSISLPYIGLRFEMFKERGYVLGELNNVLIVSWIRRRRFHLPRPIARFVVHPLKKPKSAGRSSRARFSEAFGGLITPLYLARRRPPSRSWRRSRAARGSRRGDYRTTRSSH